MRPVVLALVGTDHHPFDRFVDWIDRAAVLHPELRFVVQHGESRAPTVAEGRAYLSHDELAVLADCAVAVVCHAGPGTITDAREAGHVPVCVPRDPALGEHVDGHQLRFAQLVGSTGVAHTVTASQGPEGFEAALERALEERRHGRAVLDGTATEHARAALARELDELIGGPATRRRRPPRSRDGGPQTRREVPMTTSTTPATRPATTPATTPPDQSLDGSR